MNYTLIAMWAILVGCIFLLGYMFGQDAEREYQTKLWLEEIKQRSHFYAPKKEVK
jgi:hypothetical protein